MHYLLHDLKLKHWRTIQNVAHQLAGRKARRSHHNLNIPRAMQDRRRQSPLKDIAGSHMHQILGWLNEDGDHEAHHRTQNGGSLSNALRRVYHTAHHVYLRDLATQQRTGGGLHKGIKRIGDMLRDTAKAVGVVADVSHDRFLHHIGIRKKLHYRSAEHNDQMRFHARLNREVYKAHPEAVGGFTYSAEDSTRDYGVFHNNEKAYMVFRGTDPSKLHENMDAVDDARIATGLTGEFSTNAGAKAKLKELIARHGQGNVNVSGYSLGGGRMLEAISDGEIYKGLGMDNFALAPGLTTMHGQLKRFSSYGKMQYAYHHNDVVANGMLAHKNDSHHIFYDEANPVKGHLFLDKLADG